MKSIRQMYDFSEGLFIQREMHPLANCIPSTFNCLHQEKKQLLDAGASNKADARFTYNGYKRFSQSLNVDFYHMLMENIGKGSEFFLNSDPK